MSYETTKPGWKFNLPLNPIDKVNQPPLHFLWVQDGLTLLTGICWVVAYILYIRQGFKDRSYGIPMLAVCANIGWELIYGLFSPPSVAESLAWAPCFFIDIAIIYTTLRFGPEQWKSAPMVANNLGLIIGMGGITATVLNWAFLKMFPLRDDAAFWSGFGTQVFLGSSSLAQLLTRGNTSGHSLTIWAWRYVGSAAPIAMFSWRHWHYPDDYPLVNSPMAIFMFVSYQVADWIYPFVYAKVSKREGLKNKRQ